MRIVFLILFCISIFPGFTQDSTQTVNKKRLRTLLLVSAGTYTAGLIGLNQLWYAKFPKESFHFFNDNSEWNQVDKIGHYYSSFHLSQIAYKGLTWAGLEKKKSMLWGGFIGMMILMPIEILDGFSSEFGASYGDMIANVSGAALFTSQMLLWDEVRIKPKFSFNRTHLASMRPDVLGDGFHEELIKDYNGQTYWLSFDLKKFLPNNKVPGWLNLALGYGSHNMIFANRQSNINSGLNPYRQYYLSIDFDLSYIRTKSGFAKTLLFILDGFHLPAPAFEFNKSKGFKFHYLYF